MHLASPAVQFDDGPSFSPTALADDPRLEAEILDDRRASLLAAAETYDPEGLYSLEVARDDAAEFLADNLPADVSIRLARHKIVQRIAGEWQTIEGWVASVTTADSSFTLSENGDSPLVAAEKLVNTWRRTAPIPMPLNPANAFPRPAA